MGADIREKGLRGGSVRPSGIAANTVVHRPHKNGTKSEYIEEDSSDVTNTVR